jgi:mono/diheme cytochrome c family protein
MIKWLLVSVEFIRRQYLLASVVAAGLLSTAPALALESAEVAAGHELAQKWCATCHLVDPGQSDAGATGVPPFASIAAMTSTTSASIHAFLMTPHGKMPDFELSRRQIDIITDYILSLKTK